MGLILGCGWTEGGSEKVWNEKYHGALEDHMGYIWRICDQKIGEYKIGKELGYIITFQSGPTMRSGNQDHLESS
jgi:hypothetical protein